MRLHIGEVRRQLVSHNLVCPSGPQGLCPSGDATANHNLARHEGGHLPPGEYRWAFDKGCNAVGIQGLGSTRSTAHHGIAGHPRGR